jgi:hypothetical protein
MTDDKAKLRYIVLPFLTGGAMLVAGYAALRWLVDIRMGSGYIIREFWELLLPIILALLFITLRMHPRLQLLPVCDMYRKAICWAAGIALAVSMMGSQFYITSASRRMHRVETLSAIGPGRPNDGYRILTRYKLGTDKAGMHLEEQRLHRRYRRDVLDLHLYLAIPLAEIADSTGPYTYWHVKEYYERISEITDNNVVNARLRLHYRAVADLKGERFRMDLLTAAPLTSYSGAMLAAIKKSPACAAAQPVVMLPMDAPFEKSDTGFWVMCWAFAAALVIVVHVTFSANAIPENKLGSLAPRTRKR